MILDDLKAQYDVTEYIEPIIVIPEKPENGLVLLVGNSGSGKTTILKKWFGETKIEFDNSKALIENFSTIEKGIELLKAFGLRSIPVWLRPFNTLSNGEAHRAVCAKYIDNGCLFIDEFTSVVDRDTAKSLSASIRKWHKDGLLVLASCHKDIEEWLCPDIIYDTDKQKFIPRRFLWRPPITINIYPSTFEDWVLFKKHHYLSGDVSKACHFYTAYLDTKPIGFVAVMHRCGRDIKSYWGESRLVVLPEFQGLGIGCRLSEAIAEEYTHRGLRYFAKTSHPILGEYRNKNENKWRKTSTNQKKRASYLTKDGAVRKQKNFGKSEKSTLRDAKRLCYSHEYIG